MDGILAAVDHYQAVHTLAQLQTIGDRVGDIRVLGSPPGERWG